MRSLRTTPLLASLLVGACAAPTEDAAPTITESPAASASPAAADHAGAATRVGPALDSITAVRERAPRVFRATPEGTIAGGDETYAVEVTRDAARFRPRHDEDGPGPGAATVGAAAVLRTVSLGRAEAGLLGTAAVATIPAVDARGAVRRAFAAGVAEELENTSAGLEQRWSFAARPAGRGDLRVRVEVAGYDFVSTDDTGLHFVDPVSGLGLVYGHATWIDATGARTALPVTWDGVHLGIDVPARLVDAARYPAVLDPIVSGELAVGVPIPGAHFPAAQSQAAIACNDTQCLVTWTDNRRGEGGLLAVYGTRIDESGTVFDPAGIPVALSTNSQDPAVATDGTDFFVAYQLGSNGGVSLCKVMGATGALGVNTNVVGSPSKQPAVAAGNGHVLVAWTDDTAADDVSTRLYTTAMVSATGRTVLANQSGNQGAPALTYLPTKQAFYAVWESNELGTYDIYARPVSSTTGLASNLRKAASTAAGDQRNPDVASAGGAIAQIVWQDARVATDTQIYANRGSLEPLTHTMLNGQGYLVRGETGSGKHDLNPSIGFSRNSQAFLVAWQQNYGSYAVMGERLNATGNHLATASVLVGYGRGSGRPAVGGFGPANFFNHIVAFADGNERAHAVRFYTWGGYFAYDAPGLILGMTGNTQVAPSVASDGTRFLAVWADQRNVASSTDADIYGAIVSVDASGVTTIVGGEFPIMAGPTGAYTPDVAFDGTNYVVVWKDSRGLFNGSLYYARVTPDGQVLDPGGVAVPGTFDWDGAPSVAASADGRWAVAWPSISQSTGSFSLMASFFQGTTSLGVMQRQLPTALSTFVDLASDGAGNYLAVFPTGNGSGLVRELHGLLLTGGATEQVLAVAPAGGDINSAQVVFGGGAYQVTFGLCTSYSSAENCPAGAELGTRRVSATGAPLGGAMLPSTGAAEAQPTIAWNGTRFQTAWLSRTNSGSNFFESGISGLVLNADGSFIASAYETWIAAWNQGRHRRPRLACRTSDGMCLLAYERFHDSENTDRVKLRSVRP